MNHTPKHRRLLASAASVILAIAAAGMVAPTAGAAAPKLSSMSVYGTQANTTTSTGDKVTVSVSAHRYWFSGVETSMDVTLYRTGESHSWDFPIAKADFALAASGRGKIAPATVRVAPFGAVKLSVSPNGAAKVRKCQGQVVSRSQPVKISGTFFFDTRSGGSGWGTVGSKTKNFTFTTAAEATWHYDTDAECGDSYSTCASSLMWGAYGNAEGINGVGRRVLLSRSVDLAKPAGSHRSDIRQVSARSVKLTENVKAKTAKLAIVGNGTSLRGSAVLTGENRFVYSNDCKEPNKRVSTTSWSSITLKHGATPLQSSDIFGALSVADGANGFLYRNTVRRR